MESAGILCRTCSRLVYGFPTDWLCSKCRTVARYPPPRTWFERWLGGRLVKRG